MTQGSPIAVTVGFDKDLATAGDGAGALLLPDLGVSSTGMAINDSRELIFFMNDNCDPGSGDTYDATALPALITFDDGSTLTGPLTGDYPTP